MMLRAYVLSPDLSEDEGYHEYFNEEWVECGLSIDHHHKWAFGDRLQQGRVGVSDVSAYGSK